MAFVKTGSIGTGEILTAGDLTAAPLTSLTMDVTRIEFVSLGCTYALGGGSTVTAIELALEVSYDAGSNWFSAAVNPDAGTPPDTAFAAGTLNRLVSAADTWAVLDLRVSSCPLIRLVATVVGTPASGDLLTVHAYGENEMFITMARATNG